MRNGGLIILHDSNDPPFKKKKLPLYMQNKPTTMEAPVRVKDKYFQKYITKEEIEKQVIALCEGLKGRYEGKEPVFFRYSEWCLYVCR